MANRKGEPICCFDCIPCADGEISNRTGEDVFFVSCAIAAKPVGVELPDHLYCLCRLQGSTYCERCPPEFWSNSERTACIPRQLDFLSFNETLGITLTAVAVSGATVTTAVFVVFLRYRQTPVVRKLIIVINCNVQWCVSVNRIKLFCLK